MAQIKLKINSFLIFNSTLGPKEGEELKRILFYHPPHEDDDGRKMQVGLCEAVVKFMASFTQEPCEGMKTHRERFVFYQPEKDFWMVMVIKTPSGDIPANEYHADEVSVSCASRYLKLAYNMFRMFITPFSEISQDQIYAKCQCFFTPYLSGAVEVTSDILPGVERLPLDKKSFFQLNGLIDDLSIQYPDFKCIMLLYNQSVMWCDMKSCEDIVTMYKYLVETLLPNEMEREFSSEVSVTAGRYISPREGMKKEEDLQSVTKINLLEQPDQLEEHHLLIYRTLSLTMCFTVPARTSLQLEQVKALDAMLGPKLSDLASTIGNKLSIMTHQERYDCKSNSNSNEKPLFCHYNRLTAQFSTNMSKNKLSSSAIVKPEVFNILSDIHSQDDRLNEFGEIVIKTLDECWLTARRSNERELYVIVQQRNANLKSISDEVKKVCDTHLKGIFFYPA